MLYLILIILSVIIGLLRGGELEKLYHISIKGTYFFAVALLLRGIIWFFGKMDFYPFYEYSPFIIIISYILLIISSFQNINFSGFRYITLGVLMNSFVIFVNGGKMPVLVTQQFGENISGKVLFGQGQNIIYSLTDKETLFTFLGDVLTLPKLFPGNSIISVGDVMIYIGIFILIQKVMLKEEFLSNSLKEILNE